MYGAIWTPLQSDKACFLFVVYVQQASKHLSNIHMGIQAYESVQTYRGHPDIWEPKLTGVSKHIGGIQTYRGLSKHIGASKHTGGASKYMGCPNIWASKHRECPNIQGGIQTYGGIQTCGIQTYSGCIQAYRGHPKIWGCPYIQGHPNIWGYPTKWVLPLVSIKGSLLGSNWHINNYKVTPVAKPSLWDRKACGNVPCML